jgi:hypothetical protein
VVCGVANVDRDRHGLYVIFATEFARVSSLLRLQVTGMLNTGSVNGVQYDHVFDVEVESSTGDRKLHIGLAAAWCFLCA